MTVTSARKPLSFNAYGSRTPPPTARDPSRAALAGRFARRRPRRRRQRRRRRLPRRVALQRARRGRAALARRARARRAGSRTSAAGASISRSTFSSSPASWSTRCMFLGEAIDRGIDAVIVQDLGLVRLIQRLYPELEIHGSTQMTVHDESGAARARGDRRRPRRARAREHARRHPRHSRRGARPRPRDVRPRRALHLVLGTVLHVRHDLRAQRQPRLVRAVVPQGLRAHRRATREELDRGYLISAKDLAAHEHLAGDRRRRHRLPQGRRAKEEARVRRDRHEGVSRVSRSARARRTARRRPSRKSSRSCRSSAADSPAACSAAAKAATTSRARSRTTAASSSARSSATSAAS